MTTPTNLNLHYLATFDSGNGAVRWPQKDVTLANQHRAQWNQEIAATIKLNLLWRPFIALRHFELYDNLALAKFLEETARREPNEIYALAEANLVRVCAPRAVGFEEILLDWATGKGSQFPMHWHHLGAGAQTLYDEASRKGGLNNVPTLGHVLRLKDHRIALPDMIQLYDRLFPKESLVVLDAVQGLPADWYAKQVLRKWDAFLRDRRQAAIGRGKITSAIERVLEDCANRGVRRREFFTRVEQLEVSLLGRSDRTSRRHSDELTATKCFVLNDAFYDEFEQFGRYHLGRKVGNARIMASRDITNAWLVPESPPPVCQPGARREVNRIQAQFAPLEALRFADLVDWHTSEHAEARAFQESLARIDALVAHSGPVNHSQELERTIKQHLHNLKFCALRSLKERGQAEKMEGSVAEVVLGVHPDVGAAGLSSGVAGLAYLLSHHLAHAAEAFGLSFHFFKYKLETLRTEKPAWRQLEALLEDSVTTAVSERADRQADF